MTISILEDTRPFPYLECRWINSLRAFLHSINAKIYVDLPLVSSIERSHDQYIMKIAHDCGLFTPHDLNVINYCRLYLHVTTLSELFDANGRYIMSDIYQCRREKWFDPNTYITLQARPSAYQIRMKWQRLLRQCSRSDGEIAASMTLGRWEVPGNRLRRRRQTYAMDTRMRNIFHWKDDTYWKFTRTHVLDNQSVYIPESATTWIPDKLCTPIEVQEQPDGSLIRHHYSHHSHGNNRHTPSSSIPSTFSLYLDTLPAWEQHLLQGIHLYYEPYEILHHISKLDRQSYLLMVSDGSVKNDRLAYGWVFGTSDRDIYADHSGMGYGEPTSHRAEGWGMLSAARFLNHLCNYTKSPHMADKVSFPSKVVLDVIVGESVAFGFSLGARGGKASASALKSISTGTDRPLYHALERFVSMVLSNDPSDVVVLVVNFLE